MVQDLSIWQGTGGKFSGPGTVRARPHAYPSGTAVAQAMFVTWFWPWASYLMFLSLDFLIIEMAMRMQRTGCPAASARGCQTATDTKPGGKALGKDFLPTSHM